MIRRIAVVRPTGLGDLLLAVPLFLYLKRLYPRATLTLFADRRNAPLLPFLRCWDRSVTFPTLGGKYAAVLATAVRHRLERFDLAISARASPSRVLNLFLATLGAKRRLAVADGTWHSRLLTDPRPEAPHGRHQALKCLQLVAPHFEEVPGDLWPRLVPPVRPNPLPGVRDPVVLTSVSNNRPHETLPAEMHAAILNGLADCRRIHAVVSCLPPDSERARALARRLRCPATVAPTSDLPPLLTLLARSDLAFWAQSGLSHMAAAVDIPQVVLFGKTLPGEWGPLTNRATLLHHPAHAASIPADAILHALKERL